MSRGGKKVELEDRRRECASGPEPAAISKVQTRQDAMGYRRILKLFN